MAYKNAYLSGNIHPKNVVISLEDLCNTPLYKNKGILVNNKWEHVINKSIKGHVNDLANMEYHDSIDEDDDIEPVYEEMVHGYGQTYVIVDFKNRIIQIAPSEGLQQIGIFRDMFTKELNFPTLFYGFSQLDDVTRHLNITKKIAKWELLHSSKIFSTHIILQINSNTNETSFKFCIDFYSQRITKRKKITCQICKIP